MRANSFFVHRDRRDNACDIFGAISRSSAWIASLVLAPALHQKIDETRSSGSPESSSAANVFSTVGASALPAIGVDVALDAPSSAASKTGPKSIVADASGNPEGRADLPISVSGCWTRFDGGFDGMSKIFRSAERERYRCRAAD